MTPAEFAAIAAACDRLLSAPDSSLGRVAIPLLHVISEHPSCIAQYVALQQGGNVGGRVGRHLPERRTRASQRLPGPIRDALRVARAMARSAWRSFSATDPLRAVGPVDVLLVSHLGNPTLLDGEDDFYFGPLQRLLLERGRTSLLVLVNHVAGHETVLRERATRPPPCARLLLPRTVAPVREARLWLECRRTRRRLRQAMNDATTPLDRAVAELASREALSAATAANLRLHAQIAHLCLRSRPRIVVTTHEGDASERLVWLAARSATPGVLCAGYQHTRLLARSHAIRRRLGTHSGDPDVILTLGESTHAMLAASPQLARARLIMYGSHRRGDATIPPERGGRPCRCVVVPDGDDRECSTLFGFALECARRMPTMSFSLRPHPIVGFDALRARHPMLQLLPDNVAASPHRLLEGELTGARYCLYRGSSAVIYAVLAGLKPFYLARPGEMTFDPLWALPDWRETVSTPDDFAARVAAHEANPALDAAARAWSFCDRYVARLRPEALDELLAMTAG